ncbi:MAG: thiamine phosphate synthase, partial [Isosphaeraceae bacterium]
MSEHFQTEGAKRALLEARQRAQVANRRQAEPMDLLVALLAEEESQAVALVSRLGVADSARLLWLEKFPVPVSADEPADVTLSQSLRMAVADAEVFVRSIDRSNPVGTGELLFGLVSSSKEVLREVQSLGVDIASLKSHFVKQSAEQAEPLPLPEGCDPLLLSDSVENADIARIIDASSNRVREGLRVVEDYARFALDDPSLTRGLKD